MKKDQDSVRDRQSDVMEFKNENFEEAVKVLARANSEVFKLGYNVTYEMAPVSANRIASESKVEFNLELKGF